ncbi:hypothetical protein BE20_23550 [Sorangium cellulosum]|uniref:Uncharacterized protein n=1 Tax=Sorangium cellulosum TaxID=56 RepID=A0A150S6W9_SORCE|nr:hypothetical protein BE20_23550 [Sorangium cellulosum]KYF94446.1 hypothetical protein BE18_11685 [Sorangium cellulosum]
MYDLDLRALAVRGALALLVGLPAAGCQLVSGIDAMDVDESAGGVVGDCGPVGERCGGTCKEGIVTPPGTCRDDGTCSTEPTSCGSYDCDPSGTACATSCSIFKGCVERAVCDTMSATCMACGASPPDPAPCDGCERCEGGKCITRCDTEGECVRDRMLDAKERPARLECNDQCNNIRVVCIGPYPCEVVCGDGGCQGLHMHCSHDGPCYLECSRSGCASNVKLDCGANTCLAACILETTIVDQTCGSSCSCMSMCQ